MLPSIDGHFWIERDGVIVDWDLPYYNKIKRDWKLEGDMIHLEADPVTQRLMIDIFKNRTMKILDVTEWDDCVPVIAFMLSLNNDYTVPNRCWQNCIGEISRRGGELKFGSMGWKRRDGNGIHYEYGGVNYKCVKDFIVCVKNRTLAAVLEYIKKKDMNSDSHHDMFNIAKTCVKHIYNSDDNDKVFEFVDNATQYLNNLKV